jgi:2-succinyl-5-enolpyruvyl-6-hydroxy-3-cyclohexene-1-carboxylate synthase
MLKRLAGQLEAVREGIIVCGPQYEPTFPSAVVELASQLGYPILADPLSQVRCGSHDRSLIIDTYDAFLRFKRMTQKLAPKLLLRFGTTPTSKVLQNYITHCIDARQILIHDADWQDPMHTATDLIQTDASLFARELSTVLNSSPQTEWSRVWLKVAAEAREIIHNLLSEINEMFEGRVFAELASLLPTEATLFAGNSMPVRDLDSFFPTVSKRIRFLANRGVSGVDGVVSTALGVSSVSREPTVLVVGDVSFYHDMNGLLAAKQYHPNTTIIVLNNNGGGIFSFLPQHDYPESFEEYFATPHGLTFQATASLYGLSYSKVTSWDEFRGSLTTEIGSSRPTIIEVATDRERNLQLHHHIWSAVEETAQEAFAGRT